MRYRSESLLLVVLKLHDKWLDILALRLPLANAFLGIGVEVLLLLVHQGLVVQSLVLGVHEVLLSLHVLLVSLSLKIVGQLDAALSLLFSFLLLGDGKFLVSQFPELTEFPFFSLLVLGLLLLSVDLILARFLDGLLHFSASALLLLEKIVSLGLGLSNFFVELSLLLISDLHQLCNLPVDQVLFDGLLHLESFVDLSLSKMIEGLLLGSMLLNLSLLFLLFESHLGLEFDELLVGLLEVFSGLGSLLPLLQLLHLFFFKFLLDLFLDELTLHFVFLQSLDELHLEIFKLGLNAFSILHLLVILLFQLLPQSFIVLDHLLLLQLLPLQIDLLEKSLLLLLGLDLDLLLGRHVAEEHLRVESLHHVLVVVEHLVRLI